MEAEQEAEQVRLLERQRAVEEVQRREEQKRAEAEAAKHAEAEWRKQGVIRRPKACDQCVRVNVTCEWPTEGRAKACDRCQEQHVPCMVDGKGVRVKKRKRTEGGAEAELEVGPSRQQGSGVQGPEMESGGLAALNGILVLIARKLGGIQATLTGMQKTQEGLLETLTLMCERMAGEESELEAEMVEIVEVAEEMAELDAEMAEHQKEKEKEKKRKTEKRTEKKKAKKPETEEDVEEIEEKTGPVEKKQRKE